MQSHQLLQWRPDKHLVAAVLAVPKSHIPMTEMPDMDRCYLVAGLTMAGLTAEDIAERTGCSRRLVMTIRADPRTVMAAVASDDNFELERDLRTERCQHAATRGELAEVRRALERVTHQRDDMLDQLQVKGRVDSFPRCGHERVGYNVYSRNGVDYCRKCRREWDATKRKPRPSTRKNRRSVRNNGNILHNPGLGSAP
ncbi:Uncharacterised protein [Mycolicibacterium vanbaalenii]|uniref:Uncharacterized protein n=1 Tax=Mycolicibacterium vanbaalenii TaxID=110539 RepID=A0A5S9R9A7_MYCVN|nr:Uncharacterised protein [Mycolicibacterium vanbaalenii]